LLRARLFFASVSSQTQPTRIRQQRVYLRRYFPNHLSRRKSMFRKRCLMALAFFLPAVAFAETRCEQILKKWGDQLADANCFESTDLTTNNPLTTPLDNSIPGLPLFAFTPR